MTADHLGSCGLNWCVRTIVVFGISHAAAKTHTRAIFSALILLRYFFFSLSHLKSAVSFTQTHTQSHIYTRTKLSPSIWYAFNATDVRSPTSICNGVHQQPSQPFKWREGRGLSVMLHRSQVTLFRWRDTLAVVLLHQQSAGLQGWACVCACARVCVAALSASLSSRWTVEWESLPHCCNPTACFHINTHKFGLFHSWHRSGFTLITILWIYVSWKLRYLDFHSCYIMQSLTTF